MLGIKSEYQCTSLLLSNFWWSGENCEASVEVPMDWSPSVEDNGHNSKGFPGTKREQENSSECRAISAVLLTDLFHVVIT